MNVWGGYAARDPLRPEQHLERKPVPPPRTKKDEYYGVTSSSTSAQNYNCAPSHHGSGNGGAHAAELQRAQSFGLNDTQSDIDQDAGGPVGKSQGLKNEKKEDGKSKWNFLVSGKKSAPDAAVDSIHGGDSDGIVTMSLSHYKSLKEQLVAARGQLSEKDLEIAHAKDQNKNLLNSANHMQRVMDEKELYIGGQASEESIKEGYTRMVNSIRGWTSTYCSDLQQDGLDAVETALMNKQPEICPNGMDFSSFERHKKYRKLLVRAWISAVFCERIFPTLPDEEYGHPGSFAVDCWMEQQLAQSLQQLERKLFESLKRGDAVDWHQLNDWRALSCNMLKAESTNRASSAAQHRISTITSTTDTIMRTVSATIRPDVRAEAQRELEHCVEHAINLSQQLRCHRACWYLRFPSLDLNADRTDLYFNGVWMWTSMEPDEGEGEGEDGRVPVRVVVTPALFRRGNSEGVSSNVLTCQLQAEVTL